MYINYIYDSLNKTMFTSHQVYKKKIKKDKNNLVLEIEMES